MVVRVVALLLSLDACSIRLFIVSFSLISVEQENPNRPLS